MLAGMGGLFTITAADKAPDRLHGQTERGSNCALRESFIEHAVDRGADLLEASRPVLGGSGVIVGRVSCHPGQTDVPERLFAMRA